MGLPGEHDRKAELGPPTETESVPQVIGMHIKVREVPVENIFR